MTHTARITMAAVVALALAAGTSPAADDPLREDTGRNPHDRSAVSPTAGQQSNDPADLKLTQDIRKAVVDDDSLSTNAHNVKIITIDRVVTLRGPVDSAAEKSSVAAKAQQVAGVKRVDNQLEVTTR